MHALYATVFNFETGGGSVREISQVPFLFGAGDHLQDEVQRAWDHESCVWIPHGAPDRIFFEEGKLLRGLAGRNQARVGPEGLAGRHLSLQFFPALGIVRSADFHAAALEEETVFGVEVSAVGRRPVAELVVAGIEDEVRRVRGRPDVRGHGPRLLKAYDVADPEFREEVGERSTHDAAHTHDHDVGRIGKLSFAQGGSPLIARAPGRSKK